MKILKLKKSETKVIIIGCGVSGLSCGILLIKHGYPQVTIISKELPPNTTSDVAAATWRPYRIMPEELAIPWARQSLKIFTELSQQNDSGVMWINLTEVYKRKRTQPEWMNFVESASTPYVPSTYPCSFSVRVPLIDTSIYMPYLMQKFKALGGTIIQEQIHNLHEIENINIIINCSGVGARQLVHDKKVFPIRGQVIRLTKPKELNYGIVEFEDEMTYIYPRHDDCIVGSTAEENQWDLHYDRKAASAILERAIKLCPLLNSEEILEYKVGVRPSRNEVRLEVEPFSTKTIVIHNYGHGGRGFTLSWGCAREVLKLINRYHEY